jgi:hypothetical protein
MSVAVTVAWEGAAREGIAAGVTVIPKAAHAAKQQRNAQKKRRSGSKNRLIQGFNNAAVATEDRFNPVAIATKSRSTGTQNRS